jgi:hypothetical protein
MCEERARAFDYPFENHPSDARATASKGERLQYTRCCEFRRRTTVNRGEHDPGVLVDSLRTLMTNAWIGVSEHFCSDGPSARDGLRVRWLQQENDQYQRGEND